MIKNTLTFLKGEVNKFMRLHGGTPTLEDGIVLSNIVNSDSGGSGNLPADKMVLSLICIEEERNYKSQNHYHRAADGTFYTANPELHFNLYIMFAAHFTYEHYDEGLKALSLILRFFQGKQVFDAKEYPDLKDELVRIIVDLHTQPLEQQSQLWQAMGGKFLPSIMYKVRMLTINEKLVGAESQPITEIQR